MEAIKIIQILINVLQLMLQIFYYICQSVYYNCFGLQEKDVTDEIVLVRTKTIMYQYTYNQYTYNINVV